MAAVLAWIVRLPHSFVRLCEPTTHVLLGCPTHSFDCAPPRLLAQIIFYMAVLLSG